MRKTFLAAVLAVSIIGLFSLFNAPFSEQLNAQELRCWCCVKGEVVQTTPAVCKEKGGVCFRTKDEAVKNCQKCWCCVNGEVSESTFIECKQKGGVCFSTKEEAVKRCPPPPCWCCLKGQVVQLRPAVCKEKGGVCFKTKDEALKNCRKQ